MKKILLENKEIEPRPIPLLKYIFARTNINAIEKGHTTFSQPQVPEVLEQRSDAKFHEEVLQSKPNKYKILKGRHPIKIPISHINQNSSYTSKEKRKKKNPIYLRNPDTRPMNQLRLNEKMRLNISLKDLIIKIEDNTSNKVKKKHERKGKSSKKRKGEKQSVFQKKVEKRRATMVKKRSKAKQAT